MKRGLQYSTKAFLLSITAAAVLAAPLQADCTYELFNIASVKGTTVGEFIDQLSEECSMSVIVADPEAEKVLAKPMNKTFLKNLTINEVLDLIIKESDLQYTLQNNVLKVSYLKTKTYSIDYITSKRKGEGSTNIRLSSNTGTTAGASGGVDTSGNKSSSESGTNISTVDEVLFWETLEKEIKSILNRPEDSYKADSDAEAGKDSKTTQTDHNNVFINKSAGLVTVTANGKQLERLDTYINDLQKRMQTQVLIDVKMYSVVFSDSKTTGIDWSQLYALQNFDLKLDYINSRNVSQFTSDPLMTGTEFTEYGSFPGRTEASIFQLGGQASIKELVKFLKTQGDVYAISNPKILTLNNQPALITSGTELFYKTVSTSTLAGGTTGEQATTEVISSVFSGVLLDITPEIANDGSITLRINPSISETASEISADNAARSMPPDLSRRQISSVISVKDGNRVILGGLINTKNSNDGNKIPLLGDIPVLGHLFKREGMNKKTEEMVIVIEPHIIKREGETKTIADLGYTHIDSVVEKNKLQQAEYKNTTNEEISKLKEDSK